MSYANCRRTTGGSSGVTALLEQNAEYVYPNVLQELVILDIPAGLKSDFIYQLQISLGQSQLNPSNAYLEVSNGIDVLATQCTDAGQVLNSQFTLQFVYQGTGALLFTWINSGTQLTSSGVVDFNNVQLTELGEVSVL